MSDFITWLAALAPEDETMLFVRQKPNKKGGYSYVAYLPERARDRKSTRLNSSH